MPAAARGYGVFFNHAHEGAGIHTCTNNTTCPVLGESFGGQRRLARHRRLFGRVVDWYRRM